MRSAGKNEGERVLRQAFRLLQRGLQPYIHRKHTLYCCTEICSASSADCTLFSIIATYDFLAFEDASKDKILDILFVRKDREGNQNVTCAARGMGIF